MATHKALLLLQTPLVARQGHWSG